MSNGAMLYLYQIDPWPLRAIKLENDLSQHNLQCLAFDKEAVSRRLYCVYSWLNLMFCLTGGGGAAESGVHPGQSHLSSEAPCPGGRRSSGKRRLRLQYGLLKVKLLIVLLPTTKIKSILQCILAIIKLS